MSDPGDFDDRLLHYLRRRAAHPAPDGMVERLARGTLTAPTRLHRPWRRNAAAGVAFAAVLATVLAVAVGRHDDGGRPGPSVASLNPGTPPARAWASMGYDPVDGTDVLFGGTNTAGGPLTDTWIWNGTAWAEAHPAVHPPAGTEGAPMVADAADGGLLFLDGPSIGLPTGRTVAPWLWNGSTWTLLRPAHSPTGSVVAATPDPHTGGVLVLISTSGIHTDGCTYQTWEWSGGDWQRLAPAQSLPTGEVLLATDPRSGAVVAVTGSRPALAPIGMFTPQCAAGSPQAQAYPTPTTWTWDGGTWVDQPSAGTPRSIESVLGPSQPPAIDSAALVPGQAGLVLFDSAWRAFTWNGRSWSAAPAPAVRPQSAAGSPGAVVAADVARGEVVAFGGYVAKGDQLAGSAPTYATWTWDGTAWRDRTADQPAPPTASPTPGTAPLCLGGPLQRLTVTTQGSGQNVFIAVSAPDAGSCAIAVPVHVSVTGGSSSAPLHVSGNPADAHLAGKGDPGAAPFVTFLWANWCGSEQAPFTVTITGGSQPVSAVIRTAPPCGDPSQPSRLLLTDSSASSPTPGG